MSHEKICNNLKFRNIIFACLFVCLNGDLCRFQQYFSYITALTVLHALFILTSIFQLYHGINSTACTIHHQYLSYITALAVLHALFILTSIFQLYHGINSTACTIHHQYLSYIMALTVLHALFIINISVISQH